MPSKYVDTTAIIQVIGNVFKTPKLLDLTDKYVIVDEDFPDAFHKVAFGAIYKLHELGAEKVTLESINDFLSSRPRSEGIFKEQKGEEWLLKVAEASNPDTFDYYYKRLKKFTLLRAYDNCGVDISDIYDPDNILDIKKKQYQEDCLDNATLEQIADRVDAKIDSIRAQYVDDNQGESVQASAGIKELIEKFKERPEVGIPLYGPLINTVTRGARLKKFYLRSAATGTGKAITNDTKIPTPKGWKTVGEIKKGDYLFNAWGRPTKVLAIHPQLEKKKIWVVRFEDGREIKCCSEHLWEYTMNGITQVSNTETLSKCSDKIYMKTNYAVDYDPLDYTMEECRQFIKQIHTGEKLEFMLKALVGSAYQRMVMFYQICGFGTRGRYENENPQVLEFMISLMRSLGYFVQPEGENAVKFDTMRRSVQVESITETEETADMTCFTVDDSEHLFLVGDYVVTHNTRSMIADACYMACEKIYDETFGWIGCGVGQPVLFITTEQTLDEIQTMMLAFISDVNEEHILNGEYIGDEEERIQEAIRILSKAPLYVEEMPDFSLQDVETTIKRGIRERGVNYILLDYLHTSMKILEEITRKSGGLRLREDNILFMLSNKLKDICNQYGVFILSATQLNGSYQEAETPDQNLLRGAKSLADKIDAGLILLNTRTEDMQALEKILSTNLFDKPNIKISVYKNRRGQYKGIYLWAKADLGTCRIKPMFATTWNYELIEMSDFKIKVEEPGAF